MRKKIGALLTGLLIPVIAFCGLETGTYISDLVVTNPLSSDLASTADDHIRLLKSTIKTTFPNINNAVTVTDEQLNAVATNVAANPTGTIGLTAVNGSAATYIRSDGAPALSQAIAPTWTQAHVFTKSGFTSATNAAVSISAAQPVITWNETGVTANNGLWAAFADAETFKLQVVNDAVNAGGDIMTVDRTGTTVDLVTFPTAAASAFLVGTATGLTAPSSGVPMALFATNSSVSVAHFENSSATNPTVFIGSDQTGGNTYIRFYDGGDPDGTTGSITTNGTSTAYGTSSDERLKKNFKSAPSARRVIDCIQIESYDWKQTGDHVDHGLVAQRLNRCAPYAVTRGDVWQVDKSALIPALIKYVQEQDARIARLEADAARRH